MPPPRIADKGEIKDFVVMLPAPLLTNLANRLVIQFGVSRPTAHKYIGELISDGVIRRTGMGSYELAEEHYHTTRQIVGLEEHVVWTEVVAPLMAGHTKNVRDIVNYGCNEMVNNAIDHSDSTTVDIEVRMAPTHVELHVEDHGVGIFRKIANSLGLEDDRHAVLELAKGKVTTDPINHTGEGIFFSSRAFDRFHIYSGGVLFSHEFGDDEDWITGDEQPQREVNGTLVAMMMRNDSETDLQDVFDEYSSGDDDYGFDKTVVPVKLMQYGDDQLVSRSQAKRLMNRFDRFQTVVLDFDGVPAVGQAFADEVFRVFQLEHPEIDLVAIRANEQVARMMNRALKSASSNGAENGIQLPIDYSAESS